MAKKVVDVIDVDRITLIYTCPECSEMVTQPLNEITLSGTAVCCECDVDMELGKTVQICEETK